MQKAIEIADINAEELDYINAHGTGTVMNDEVEMKVIKSIFSREIITTSLKSFIGHTLGASAVTEIAIVLAMLKEKMIYQAKDSIDPIDEKFIPKNNVNKKVKYFLKNSFGFGGNNVSLIFKINEGYYR